MFLTTFDSSPFDVYVNDFSNYWLFCEGRDNICWRWSFYMVSHNFQDCAWMVCKFHFWGMFTRCYCQLSFHFSHPPLRCGLCMFRYTITLAYCFRIGIAHGWGTFPRWGVGLGYCLTVGPLFSECSHPRVLAYTLIHYTQISNNTLYIQVNDQYKAHNSLIHCKKETPNTLNTKPW